MAQEPPIKTATNDLGRALAALSAAYLFAARQDLEAVLTSLLVLRRGEIERGLSAGSTPAVRQGQAAIDVWERRWASRTGAGLGDPGTRQRVQRSLERAANQMEGFARRELIDLGIAPGPSFAAEAAALQLSQTLRGVSGRREAQIGQIAELADRALVAGKTPGEVFKEVGRIADTNTKRARLLARNMVGDMVAEVSRQTYQAVGIKEFVWRTQGDSRVRQEHRELNGKKFPIATGAPGVGLPGQPINCRCFPEPVRLDSEPAPNIRFRI